jgi:hypothetical protein
MEGWRTEAALTTLKNYAELTSGKLVVLPPEPPPMTVKLYQNGARGQGFAPPPKAGALARSAPFCLILHLREGGSGGKHVGKFFMNAY